MIFEAKQLWELYASIEKVADLKARKAERHSWDASRCRKEANDFSLAKDLLLGVFGSHDETKHGRPMKKREILELEEEK